MVHSCCSPVALPQVIHARWAMLGAAGCIAPEVLGKAGVIPSETAIEWFRSGVIPPAGVYKGYWADPFTLFFVEVIAIQFAELKRLQDYRCVHAAAGQAARTVPERPAAGTAAACTDRCGRARPTHPRPLHDRRNPGSQAKQDFLGLEYIFKGSSNPAYPGACCWHDVAASQRPCMHAMQAMQVGAPPRAPPPPAAC